MLKQLFFLCATLLFSFTAFAWSKMSCDLIRADQSEFLVEKVQIHLTGLNQAEMLFQTSSGEESFQGVDCYKETTPENLLSCEHDLFIFIVSLDEKPMPAALNPFVHERKEYGPFYMNCSVSE